EKLLGSKTAFIIGKSPIPVIAIPWDYEWEKPERLLLATNNYEKPGPELNTFFEIADLFMAAVHIVTFTDEENADAIQYMEAGRKMREYAETIMKTYQEDNLTTAHLVGPDFEDSIQTYIRERNIGMLCMITYRKGFWSRLFNPSYTKRMSYHSNVPLLAIPAQEKENVLERKESSYQPTLPLPLKELSGLPKCWPKNLKPLLFYIMYTHRLKMPLWRWARIKMSTTGKLKKAY